PRGSKWAGIGIGLAAAVKLTPAIFILYLLVSRRRGVARSAPSCTSATLGLRRRGVARSAPSCTSATLGLRRRRAALTAALTAITASLAAFALMPYSSWHYWTHTLWGGDGLGNAGYTFNQSIYAMLARFSAPADPNRLLWVALVLIAVV